jgi:rhodanese-related sulfurtransferase
MVTGSSAITCDLSRNPFSGLGSMVTRKSGASTGAEDVAYCVPARVAVILRPMAKPSATPSQVRCSLLLREEIALLDIRHEAAFATGHPLFAANMAADRIALEAELRLPRKDVPIVVYDAGEGVAPLAAARLQALGTVTFVSSTAASRPGRRRVTSCSRTSIPTQRLLANWSSHAGTRRRCRLRKSRN